MTEKSTVKERLMMFLHYLNISQGKFEKALHLSNGYVNNIKQSITPQKLSIIAAAYPELNTGWLMTGDGEMLKTGSPAAPQSSSVGDGAISIAGDENKINSDSTLLKAISEIAEQRKLVAKSQEQIDRLITIIERMNDNIK